MAFELSPPAKLGEPWIETVLHSFPAAGNSDGSDPQGSFTIDRRGALYGTTVEGGGTPCVEGNNFVGCGTVYRLTPPAMPGGAWTENILYRFQGGSDGQSPYGNVALNQKKAALYGTTLIGGTQNKGSIYQITP